MVQALNMDPARKCISTNTADNTVTTITTTMAVGLGMVSIRVVSKAISCQWGHRAARPMLPRKANERRQPHRATIASLSASRDKP